MTSTSVKTAQGLEGARIVGSNGKHYLLQGRISKYVTATNTSYSCIELESRTRYVCKVVAKQRFGDSGMNNLLGEIRILRGLHHKNILCIEDFLVTDDFVFVIFPFMAGGRLFDKINELGRFKEADACNVLFQIAEGLNYLHEKGICHGSVKPENILCSTEGGDFRVVLSFFSVDQYCHSNTLNTISENFNYSSPESLKHEEYTTASDMWSFGVVSYVLLTGRYPFQIKRDRFPEALMSGSFNTSHLDKRCVSEPARAFLSKLLVADPEKRCTATEILEDPWLNGSDSSDVDLSDSAKSLSDLNFSSLFEEEEEDDDDRMLSEDEEEEDYCFSSV